jgi:hypothetical protein
MKGGVPSDFSGSCEPQTIDEIELRWASWFWSTISFQGQIASVGCGRIAYRKLVDDDCAKLQEVREELGGIRCNRYGDKKIQG